MTNEDTSPLIPTGPATAILPAGNCKSITVIGTEAIRATFDEQTLRQAVHSRRAPGVTDVVLNPDAHVGYGAPIGCVMVSPSHIYPGPVGVDIKCSMSLLQLNLPADAIRERPTRRALINAICDRTPTGPGMGQRNVPKSRKVDASLGRRVAIEGASAAVCETLGIPADWAARCEDAFHVGHDDTQDALTARLDRLEATGAFPKFAEKISQLGSYGGGNHFGKEVVDGHLAWVHRKGATRAFPAGHHALKGTPFADTGHPILLPGNPRDGSVVMVADEGAVKSCYSVNHGAGRQLGRKEAIRQFDQKKIDDQFNEDDILTNCRQYPKDEAPAAYKDFDEVVRSVTGAGLATEIARLRAKFVIKDASKADD
ncbi:MAG: RtcB family protein [Pirellulaceae bacterium]|nr:RtcB family protein [Pirellulaceae bacterium]